MLLRRTATTSALALTLVAGLAVPHAVGSAVPGSPESPDPPDQAAVERAEELGYAPDDPDLEAAIAEAEAASADAAAFASRVAGEESAADPFAEESETGEWIILLDSPPVATYEGGIDGLSATSIQASGDARLDVSTSESRAYVDHLEAEQRAALAQMAEELGHEVEVTRTFHYALNGMSVSASADEARAIAALPGVSHVEPEQVWEMETDVSNELINSPAVWGGDTGTGLPTLGEGVITGMIDSGVNPDHPSFAATDGEGYTHTNPLGSGNYLGVCAEGASPSFDICNDKLIGAYFFTSATPHDTDGHGSHTGSTMAGNQHDAVFTVGDTEFTRPVSGVAPRANIISYKVCAPGCPNAAIVAAVDTAIANGTDVLNYSISGPDNPWGNAVDLAFLSGFEAGIYIAASAGNTGPGQGTVSKTAPWNASVAATNSPRLIAHALGVTGPEPVPTELEEMAAVPGSGPGVSAPIAAELREVADNVRGCTAFPAGAFEGALALIERGDCDFTVKVNNAANAGALGVIMTNQVPGPPVVMGGLESTTIPAVMTSDVDGAPLRDFVRANDNAQVLLDSAAVVSTTDAWGSMVAEFSGKGPSSYDLLSPTFAAPGRNILAATAASGGDPLQYEFMQGTSMSSPHGAGAGALLRGLHADWSPAMIRSALASTANPEGMLKEDGVTPADAFDVGSGMLDLDAAGRVGLVLDETHANFVAANPATGGDPRTLNLPAIVDQACEDTCSFTRTVTSVADSATAYSVSTSGPEGLQVSVEPASFTIEPGATQELTVTVDVSTSTTGEWLMGQIALTTDGTHAGGAEVADVHYPVTVLAANPVIAVTPASLTTTLGVDEQDGRPVTIRNVGTAPLEWQLTEEGEGCELPAWVSASPTSGALAPGAQEQTIVTFDSTDLAGGTYEATLCLSSNDPATPVAQVALTLEVVEIPVIDVDPTQVSLDVPEGSTVTADVDITNTGYGVLEWTFDDAEAGPSDERVEMLREGVLLTPTLTSPRKALAFDPEDGTLLDEEFIANIWPSGTPHSVLAMPDDSGFLVSDQVTNVIRRYDLAGNDLGIFAPRGGADTSVIQNMRGMAWSPEGTLVVTAAAGGNADSLVEFDPDGTYLGTYVAPGLDGLDGPWFALFRDNDLLVSASDSRAIHSFSLDGTTANARFSEAATWPVQLAETDAGTLLAAVWSATGGGIPIGVHEFSAAGEVEWSAAIPGATNYGGVHPLGNGNMLVTSGQGVYEVGRDGTLEQEWAGPRTRLIHLAHMPDLVACQTPDEVPWLEVDPSSGSNGRGETTTVGLTLDASGLAEGTTHSARLCVSSNDEARPYVPVDVTMTVAPLERPDCDTTITGVVNGGLTVGEATGVVCVEPGARINGGVTVQPGGILFMDGVQVNGGIRSTDAAWVEITNSSIKGDVIIRGTTGPVVFEGNRVNGKVIIE